MSNNKKVCVSNLSLQVVKKILILKISMFSKNKKDIENFAVVMLHERQVDFGG